MPDTSELQLAAMVDDTSGGEPVDVEPAKRRHATRLFDLRILNHETQRDVASAIGVAAPTYGAWERGDRELRAEPMMALARHFHVTPNEILDFGEVALEIPRLDSKLERLIQLYREADPKMRTVAVEALEYGGKSRRPHSPERTARSS